MCVSRTWARVYHALHRLAKLSPRGAVVAKEEDEYERKQKQIQAELDRLVAPTSSDLLEQGLKLEQLGDVLVEADIAELAELCPLMLEQVHVDLAQGKIVRLKPSPVFMLLFRMAASEMGWREAEDGTLYV